MVATRDGREGTPRAPFVAMRARRGTQAKGPCIETFPLPPAPSLAAAAAAARAPTLLAQQWRCPCSSCKLAGLATPLALSAANPPHAAEPAALVHPMQQSEQQ
eukprot:scaffold76361_cov17-Tisochrysis_lutea.AAC.2